MFCGNLLNVALLCAKIYQVNEVSLVAISQLIPLYEFQSKPVFSHLVLKLNLMSFRVQTLPRYSVDPFSRHLNLALLSSFFVVLAWLIFAVHFA